MGTKMEDITNSVPHTDLLRQALDECGYAGCPVTI